MNILKQLGIIFLFGFAGEIVSYYLPVNIPASVLGMVLMLAALITGILKPYSINTVADFLSANMAFFFLPPAVGIIKSYNLLKPLFFKIILICVISSFITFMAAYSVVRIMQIILNQKK
jgi:holin-like protein